MKVLPWKLIVVTVVDPFAREQIAVVKAAAVARKSGAALLLLNTFMIPQPTPEAVSGDWKQNLSAAIHARKIQLERLAAPLRKRGIRVTCAVEWDYPVHEAIVRCVLRHKADLVIAESHRHGRVARWLLANTDWELIRCCPCPVWFVRSDKLPRALRLLVAVDPRHTHGKPAHLDDRLLSTAQQVVSQLDGKVQAVHAYDAPLVSSSGTLLEPIRIPRSRQSAQLAREALENQLQQLAQRHDLRPAAVMLREGDPVATLEAAVSETHADILLLGAVSRSLLKRPVIGSTAEKIIDRVECDLLIVKPRGFVTPVDRKRPDVVVQFSAQRIQRVSKTSKAIPRRSAAARGLR
jgi:universal stress protein E